MKATSSAVEIAAAVKAGKATAQSVVTAALARIDKYNGRVGAFTDVLAGRAMARAVALDTALASSKPAGPLAGVPFAVKNLFDIEDVDHTRRLAHQPLQPARPRRCDAHHKPRGCRRHTRRRPQHGRVRL